MVITLWMCGSGYVVHKCSVLYYRECHFVRIDSPFCLLNQANLKSYYKTFLKSRRETVILFLFVKPSYCLGDFILSRWLELLEKSVKAYYIKSKEESSILKWA